VYRPYLQRLVDHFIAEAEIDELSRAREEHAALTGWFEDDEEWFDERMTHFHDWYILDRTGDDALTPAERFLKDNDESLVPEEKAYFEGLTLTHSSAFAVENWNKETIFMEDLIGGGKWAVCRDMPMAGFAQQDIISCRLVPAGDIIYMGRSIIAHPRQAHESIREILDLSRSRKELEWSLADKLLKMRLKFDRYPNMRLKHVYRDPRLPVL